MMAGLLFRDLSTTEKRQSWKKICTFITVSHIPEQAMDTAKITEVLRTTPVAYGDLPVELRGDKLLKGKFAMDLVIIKQPHAPGNFLVIKVFTNMGGCWSSVDVHQSLQEDEHAYSFAYFGKNAKYSAPVLWRACKFMQEARGLLWIQKPIQETPAQGQLEASILYRTCLLRAVASWVLVFIHH